MITTQIKAILKTAASALCRMSSVLIVLSLTACSLEEHPRDQIPEEKAYTSSKDIFQNTVATLYSYIGGSTDGQGLQGTCRGVYDLQTFGSDEAMLPTRGVDWFDGGIWLDMYRHSWGPDHDLVNKSWLYLYKVITLCNNSLKQIIAHQEKLSDAEYNRFTSEVRALRAIYYWYLLDLYGRVPLISSFNASVSEVRQYERREVFDFVYSELTDVYDDLSPENSVVIDDYYGRVTRPVADFVLAKLMLNAEVYTDDNWTDNERPDGSTMVFTVNRREMNAWEATIYYCERLKLSGFQLEDAYLSNFIVHNENSKENIWVIPLDRDLYTHQQQNLFRSYHYRHAAAYGFAGENGSCATLRTLQVFGYGTDEVDNRFDMNYWWGEVRDLNHKVVTDRAGNPLVYMPFEVKPTLNYGPYLETAGARMKKYEIDRNAMQGGKLMDNDIVLFRYADVLLMRAEACLRNGDVAKGQTYFDAVRERADMPHRPLTLENLLDERLLELCWEGWRRQDLIRFNQYESLFNGDEDDQKVDETDHHTIVYPIPANALTLNPNLSQNAGY